VAPLSAEESETVGEPDEQTQDQAKPSGGDASIWDDLDEFVVIGTGGGALAFQDDPNSVIAFDAMTLQTDRIENITDIAAFTPNLEIKSAFAASNPVLFIRGIGLDDFNANSASAVAVYQDGVYMNSPAGQLFQFFDVADVNVLRGPHAGQYRNASAGAILVQSKKPSEDLEAYSRITYGNYNLIEIESAINVPIVPEVLTSRISGRYSVREGYTENRCSGQPLVAFNRVPEDDLTACTRVYSQTTGREADPFFSLGSNPQKIDDPVNDADNWAVRGQLLFTPQLRDTEMEWLLNVHGGQNRSLASQFQHRGFRRLDGTVLTSPRVPGPDVTLYQDLDGDPFAGDFNNGGKEELDLAGASLRGFWEASDVHQVVSLSAFEWHKRETLENTDANPRNLLTSLYRDEAWQFSQDLRLESFWADSFETKVGAYYIMEDLEVDNAFEQTQLFKLIQEYSQDLRSWAFYGSVRWDLLTDVTFEADVRYTHETKSFDNFSTASNLAGVSGVGLNVGSASGSFDGVSGSASLTWRFTEDHSLYIKYTRGWKPGHFNGGSVFSGQLIEPVKPENLDSYEIGANLSWLEGSLEVNFAAFYYDFQDLQIFALEQDAGSFPLPQLINAQGAEVIGAELELHYQPSWLEGLDIRINTGVLKTEYTSFVNTLYRLPPRIPNQPPPDPAPIPINYTGNAMIGAPMWTANGSAQYTFPLLVGGADFGELIPRISIVWKDDTFFDAAEGKGTLQTLPGGTIGQEAYWIGNASLLWRSTGKELEMMLWVKNFTNKEYRVQSFDITDGFDFVIDAYGAPRTFGATLSMYF